MLTVSRPSLNPRYVDKELCLSYHTFPGNTSPGPGNTRTNEEYLQSHTRDSIALDTLTETDVFPDISVGQKDES